MVFIFESPLLLELTELDLHFDQLLSFTVLTLMYNQRELISLLAILIILFTNFSFDMRLLINLHMKFAHFLLQGVDSLGVHLLKPHHLLVLCAHFNFVPFYNFVLDFLNVLNRRHLQHVTVSLNLGGSFL